MGILWQAVFIIIIIMCLVVIPYAIFYYESDDGMSSKKIMARHCESIKYTICLLGTIDLFIITSKPSSSLSHHFLSVTSQ
jgi:hypothetical protein